MGDREKCIQAQMDEYLSKPLHQSDLIQTILKCATLGGQLLEKTRERELTRAADAATIGRRNAGLSHAGFHSPSSSSSSPMGRLSPGYRAGPNSRSPSAGADRDKGRNNTTTKTTTTTTTTATATTTSTKTETTVTNTSNTLANNEKSAVTTAS